YEGTGRESTEVSRGARREVDESAREGDCSRQRGIRMARGTPILAGGGMLLVSGVGGGRAGGPGGGGVLRGDSAPNFKVAGTVVDAVTGETLTEARVTLIKTGARGERIDVVTGEGGRFEFTGVPAGKYSLRGARSGYIAATYEQHEQFSTAIVTGAEF